MKSIFLLLLLLAPLWSQWSTDSTINTPVVIETERQEHINCISDGDGGVIIAWSDARSGFNNNDIYAQKFDRFGNPQWPANGVK